jgi:fumarate reductase flavoprotein subunit
MKREKIDSVNNLQADLVIIGSGGAGLAAAVSALEKGVKDIVVLEKRGNLGGNSARAEGLFACESPVQKRLGINISRDEYFKKAMSWAHWSRVNPRIVRAYINKSGDTIRWFEEKGVNFEVTPSQPGQLPFLGADEWHIPTRGPEGRNGARLIKILEKQFKGAGGKLLLNTECKKIIRGRKGEVTGVLAVKGDGEEFRIDSGSVVIATGGFAANTELLKRYCPEYREGIHFDENAVTNIGDGLLIAAEAGAAISDAVGVLKEGPRSNFKGRFPLFFLLSPHTLWVNKKGKRFIDEGAGYMAFESVNALLMQPDCVMYAIFDSTTAQDLTAIFPEEIKRMSHGMPPFASPDEKEIRKIAASDNATFKISDSWEEIADWIRADPVVLKSTVNQYNSFYYRGYDEEFAKDVRLLHPVSKAPFYVIKGIITMIDTTGGIKTSEFMEVLDTKGNIISGLYAAGVIVDGFEGHTYDSEMAGSALGFAINSGRIAGENIARNILGNRK